MKFAPLLALSLFLPLAHAEIIGLERFDYLDGTIAGINGGTFWDWKNIAPTGHTGTRSHWEEAFGIPVVKQGQLVTNNSGARRDYNGNIDFLGAINDSNDQKVVYYRATITTGTKLPEFFYFMSDDSGTERVLLGKLFGESVFGVAVVGNPGVNSNITVMPNTTYTLVAKIDYAGDAVSLFVNPVFNGIEPVPAATAPFTNTNSSTAVRMGSGIHGDDILWDDLFVATAWSDFGTAVTTTLDEDDGPTSLNTLGDISLREAVKYSLPGSLITFAPELSGQTITLTHPDGAMQIPSDITIDATSLPAGITLNGNNTHQHFFVGEDKSLTLSGLSLTGANGGGLRAYYRGGAISNNGTLTMTRCTLYGNSTTRDEGGAISNFGNLTMTQCTLYGNSATFGGAIYNRRTLSLSHCTLSGNAASERGGAIDNFRTLTLIHSIVGGNTASSAPDIMQSNGTITPTGVNLIGNLAESGLTAGPNIIEGDPKLSPLGYFGGPVQTLHPLVGSLAIDAAGSDDPGGTDARGFPRFVDGLSIGFGARLDIGAVEAGKPFFVSEAGDAETGANFRNAMAFAPLAGQGTRIVVLPGVSPITLTRGELVPPEDFALFIDSSNLPGGLTISGNNASRVFNIPATATVAMHTLRIVDGKALSGANGGIEEYGENGENGGGIINAGALSLFFCTLSGNQAGNGGNGESDGGSGGSGGGIFSSGPLTLTACTLSGNTTGSGGFGDLDNGGSGGSGGGIFCSGPLSLTACTLSGNQTGNGRESIGGSNGGSGGSGGGIFSSGSLVLSACTLSGNQTGNGGNSFDRGGNGGFGGGIFSTSSLCLTLCTLSGNATGNGGASLFDGGSGGSGGSGGGIFSSGNFGLNACTIANNQTGSGGSAVEDGTFGAAGSGGGISGGNAYLESCIIGLNMIGSGTPDDVNVSSIEYMPGNLLGTAANLTGTGFSPTIIPNPLLAPLGDYGGPTQTMPPLPSSPAIDSGMIRFSDQRGLPTVGFPDIGAAEYQGTTDLRLFWNTDGDGDGNPFGLEQALGTDPDLADPANPRNLTGPSLNPQLHATFTFGHNPAAVPGTLWILSRSTDLMTFTEIFRYDGSSLQLAPPPFFGSVSLANGIFSLTDQTPPPGGKAFYHIEAISP